jgi:hypothetical protein
MTANRHFMKRVLFILNRMYPGRDFELVSVALNRPNEEKDVLGFLKKNQASCRNLIFASADREKLIDAFDPKWQGEVPCTVLIAPDGRTSITKPEVSIRWRSNAPSSQH